MMIEPIKKKKGGSVKEIKPFAKEGSIRPDEMKEAINRVKESVKRIGEQKTSLFPIEAFPERIQNIVNCFFETYQLPVDYHCTAILVAASTAIGNAYCAKYKSREVYPCNLFTCIIGPPGIGKTPAMRFGMYPIYNIERRYRKIHNEKMTQWHQKCEDAKRNNDTLPQAPKSMDVVIKDSTVESINQILESNPKGVVLDQDELLAWVKGMNSYRKGSDLEYFLSIWSGTPVKVTRTAKDTKWIEYPFLNVIGSVQPKMLKDLITNDKANNGFLDRILFSYPDDFVVSQETDIDVDESVYRLYDNIIQFLHELPNEFVSHRDDITEQEYLEINRIEVPLTAKARDLYKKYRNDIVAQQNQAEEESVMGLLSKLKQYCLRIALILELLDLACRAMPAEGNSDDWSPIDIGLARTLEIGEKSIERAKLIIEYFKRTSLKVLDQLDGPVNQLPKYQRAWYKELPENFTTQEAIQLATSMAEEEEAAKLSNRTIARLLNNEKYPLFRKVGNGEYQKLYISVKS